MMNMKNTIKNPNINKIDLLNMQSVGISCPVINRPVAAVTKIMNISGFDVGPERP